MSSLSVLRSVDAPSPTALPPFTPAGPRTVDLTLRLVVNGEPQAFVDGLRELIERMNAAPVQLAPAPRATPADDGATVRIHARERTVWHAGVRVELTRREFDLLLHLAEHPRQVFTRAQLLRAVWGDAHSGDRTVDVHVARLRRKLPEPLLETVRGVGYRFDAAADIAVQD